MKSEKILLIGGDKRRLYTEKYLSSQGYITVSYEENKQEFFNCIKENASVILPVPVSRDNETINIDAQYEKMSIKVFKSLLKKGDRVIGGMIPPQLAEELSTLGVQCFDYYGEELILENAELTADALLELFKESGIDINSVKIAVTGFGRTARAIAKRLCKSGAVFFVVARGKKAESDAESMAYSFVKLDNFTDEIQDFDVIINTVPSLILTEELLKNAKVNITVVDIASAPFGIDEKTANQCGVRLIRALGLPGKYYPEAAGELIGRKAESLF